MTYLTRFLDEIDRRRGFVPTPTPAPTQSQIDRYVTDAAVQLRDLLAAGDTAAAEALAVEIDDFQRAAASIGRNTDYAPPEPPAGYVPWRLTLSCWAEVLIHSPRCGREFSAPEGWDEGLVRSWARGLFREPFGGLRVERSE